MSQKMMMMKKETEGDKDRQTVLLAQYAPVFVQIGSVIGQRRELWMGTIPSKGESKCQEKLAASR